MFVLLENRMSALQVPAPEQGVWVLKTAQRCNLSSDYSAVLFPPQKKSKSYLYWQVNTFQCIPYPTAVYLRLATSFIIWPLS